MFGRINIDRKMERRVRRHKWGSINKMLKRADTKTKLAFAKACCTSSDDQAVHLLLNLMNDDDKAIQIQAVKSIGMMGKESEKTHLQWAIDHLSENSDDLHQAIKESIAEINRRLHEKG